MLWRTLTSNKTKEQKKNTIAPRLPKGTPNEMEENKSTFIETKYLKAKLALKTLEKIRWLLSKLEKYEHKLLSQKEILPEGPQAFADDVEKIAYTADKAQAYWAIVREHRKTLNWS